MHLIAFDPGYNAVATLAGRGLNRVMPPANAEGRRVAVGAVGVLTASLGCSDTAARRCVRATLGVPSRRRGVLLPGRLDVVCGCMNCGVERRPWGASPDPALLALLTVKNLRRGTHWSLTPAAPQVELAGPHSSLRLAGVHSSLGGTTSLRHGQVMGRAPTAHPSRSERETRTCQGGFRE